MRWNCLEKVLVRKFDEAVEADLNWRLGEIALLKSLTVQSHLTENKKVITRKYFVPALYAIWEGFVVNVFQEYVKMINNEKAAFSSLHVDITTKHLFSSLNLHQPSKNFEKRKKLIRDLQNIMFEPVELPLEINTGSNVNYTELKNICERYAVDSEPLKQYKAPLDKFLNYRNRIAHGDNSIPVGKEHVVEFSQTIISLMYDIIEILTLHAREKKYLASPPADEG